jgi:endo-1,4-beta-xylanase
MPSPREAVIVTLRTTCYHRRLVFLKAEKTVIVEVQLRGVNRCFLCALFALSMAVSVFLPGTFLCQTAGVQGKFLGNVIGTSFPQDFGKYWNQVTPENAGKWGKVGVSSDTNSWSRARLDSIYYYAVQKGYPFKFHNLVWKQQQPQWLANLEPAQQKRIVEAWIRICGKRYPKADMVDVVNEPIQKPAFYKNALGGDGVTGWDWVIWSFDKERQYFPNAKLLINEYNILKSKENTYKYIHVINLLKERNLIDGIGCQGHWLEKVNADTIKADVKLLAATGLPIYISEYDVNEAKDSTQLAIYKEQFPAFWDDPAVKGITFWGYVQGQTWRTDAYLVRSDGTERQALEWMRKYVSSHPVGTMQPR